MPTVNVDLDDSNPVMLLRAWLNIPRLYKGAHVDVYVSPSGVGWHVRTDYKLDALGYICSQALLWADPVRTQFALRKWVLSGGTEEHLDLMFTEKDGKSEVYVPFQEILGKYANEVKEIDELLDMGEPDVADTKIKELAKKIEPDLEQYHKSSYVGCISFNGNDLKDDLEKVLMNIADKDPSFRWRVYPVWWPEYEWLIAVFTDDNDTAWKRLTWLKNKAYKKVDDKEVLLLKDANTRMFVKERKST
jgi:hypothetical protein